MNNASSPPKKNTCNNLQRQLANCLQNAKLLSILRTLKYKKIKQVILQTLGSFVQCIGFIWIQRLDFVLQWITSCICLFLSWSDSHSSTNMWKDLQFQEAICIDVPKSTSGNKSNGIVVHSSDFVKLPRIILY